MPLEISKVLGFGLSKITSVLYIFIFCTGWSSTKLTLTNHSVALSLRSCQLLREISLGYFLSVRCSALPLLTGAGMSVGSFYYGGLLGGKFFGTHHNISHSLSTRSYAMGISARAFYTQGKCMRGIFMRGGEGQGSLDGCLRLLHCLEEHVSSTVGMGNNSSLHWIV